MKSEQIRGRRKRSLWAPVRICITSDGKVFRRCKAERIGDFFVIQQGRNPDSRNIVCDSPRQCIGAKRLSEKELRRRCLIDNLADCFCYEPAAVGASLFGSVIVKLRRVEPSVASLQLVGATPIADELDQRHDEEHESSKPNDEGDDGFRSGWIRQQAHQHGRHNQHRSH